MKRKIQNPYSKVEGYNCFGCSHKNHLGLKMSFSEIEDGLVCEWLPEEHFQGWMGVLHGIYREMLRNIAVIDTFLYDSEGELCAQGECKYFTFSDEVGRNEYHYPGKDAFFGE